MSLRDAERLELERAVDLLGRSTRPGRLLEFLGAKYFSKQESQLTEFDIAREVFGRSLENFDPPAATSAPSAATPGSSASAPGQLTELHYMAGYTGGEVIDNSGTRWTPDQYYAKGGTWPRSGGFVRGTSRPFLFKIWRVGEFGYDLPM